MYSSSVLKVICNFKIIKRFYHLFLLKKYFCLAQLHFNMFFSEKICNVGNENIQIQHNILTYITVTFALLIYKL